MANHRVGGATVIDVMKPPANFTGGLEFSALNYTVTKKNKLDGKWTAQEVDLLHRITGYAPKGSVTAVMGPSGAGKSTFLDALAGRIASGSLEGLVSLDGSEMSPTLIKSTSAYIMQDDRLFPMLTVYETLMFAADFRLGSNISRADKRKRVETLIEQLGLTSSRNTYIGDEGTRGVSGGERRRVSIGVDIIHGPPLLFLDEPTSGLDSTSAHSVIEKVHQIARSGSTVVLTIHQPSYRVQMLLDHLIILARGQLMFIGSPKEVGNHLQRMGRRVPRGENSIEHLLDVIQEYDQSEHGVAALADFCLTGLKPPKITSTTNTNIGDHSYSASAVCVTPPMSALLPSLAPQQQRTHHHLAAAAANGGGSAGEHYSMASNGRAPLSAERGSGGFQLQHRLHPDEYDHSLRSPGSSIRSPWRGGGVMDNFSFTPSRRHRSSRRGMRRPQHYNNMHNMTPPSLISDSGYYTSNDMLSRSPTPHSSDYTVNEDDYRTPDAAALYGSSAGGGGKKRKNSIHLAAKFPNSYMSETWILMRRNFTNIRRTPELFLSRQMVLTVMGLMMATMFLRPKADIQGITDRLSFFIFTVCLFFFSSNDAVPAFIQERFIFVRESSHNAYRASTYVVSGLVTYLPFFAVQAATYAIIVWYALGLRGEFHYFLLALYMSLLSTNSFVVFISAVVPNFILGYAAVIAFTALFFLFCGYFLSSKDIPTGWKWMNIVSTMKYPYEGLLMNQFQTDQVFGQDQVFQRNVTGVSILEQLNIDSTNKDHKWMMLLYMSGWAAFYRILFYLMLRFASKNQRT